jgi:DNA-directed RNA polymerase specialized sigma24 family protein
MNLDENSERHASDLEWMLRSQQVDDEILVEQLLDEYYADIYQLALSQLEYPKLAAQAARETFIRAVSTAKVNPPDEDIKDWLFSIAAGEINQQQKYLAEQRLRNSRLISALIGTEIQETGTPTGLVLAKQEIIDQLHTRQAAGIKSSRYKEIVLAGLTIISFILILQLAAIVFPADEKLESHSDQNSSQFKELLNREINSAEGPEHDPYRILTKPPLTIDSSHEEIWRRILMSRLTWTSLWADVSVILHGPSDYIGPPLVERHQVWISQAQGGIHISGPPNGEHLRLENITQDSKGPGNLNILDGIEDYSRLGSQIPWFYMSSDSIASVPYMTNFFFIADYDFPPKRLFLQAVEESVWAERPVVVVNVTDNQGSLQATLWVDAITGLALREQFFSGDGTYHVRLETIVERVEFNQAFLDDVVEKIFSGENGVVFAANYSGEPEQPENSPDISVWQAISSRTVPPAMHPPEDFNAGEGRLTFAVIDRADNRSPGKYQVQLYADQYRLGELFLNDPWHSICARSPDGMQVVISQWSPPPDKPVSTVGWYDLNSLQPNLIQIPGVTITRLIFSPDNRQIAAAGIDQLTGLVQLYLIDTRSGESKLIPGFQNIWSLAWSPDSTSIAGLNLPSFRIFTPWKVRILVYEIESEEISSTTIEDNFSWGRSSAQIPVEGWIADFPLSMHGLEPCTNPVKSIE